MGALSIRTVIFGGLLSFAAGLTHAQTPQRPPVGGIGSPPDAMIGCVVVTVTVVSSSCGMIVTDA